MQGNGSVTECRCRFEKTSIDESKQLSTEIEKV